MMTFKLNNGVEIPAIGFGTYKLPDDETGVNAVAQAIADGYRLIDGAAVYANEKSVGKGIAQSGVDRASLFVTSKVWNTDRGYDATLRAFDKSLADLGLDYLDLYLIHWPASPHQFADWKEINHSTWKALERLYEDKRVRAIGLSNFMPEHLEALALRMNIPPAVNQIEFNPGFQQRDCHKWCTAHNIVIEAWSPLGRGRIFDNSLLRSLALKYDRTEAQICLRWEIQQGVVALPKSVNADRIRQNIDVFDFELSATDIEAINNLPDFGNSGLAPDTVDF